MSPFSTVGPGPAPVNPSTGLPTRRLILRQTVSGMLAWGAGSAAIGRSASGEAPDAVEPDLIVRNARPLDLETPVSALDRWLTPNSLFFVRSHFGVPAMSLAPFRLSIGGMVDRPLELTLDDLSGFAQVTVPAVLQCSGNGRAFFRPAVPGVGWERGAVGHAEWSGVRLADLLERAGLRTGAAHVHLLGADGPPSPKTPPFLRSIPLDRALSRDTLLATRMNGVPLPLLHGGPVRLVVPTWAGNHWMKWARAIAVARDEAAGTYQQTGYRMPKVPAAPGAVLKPADLVPVTTLNVKSLIAWPSAEGRLAVGRHEVRGVAWTGVGHVVRVEFSTDRDPAWRPAALQGPERAGSWRTWRVAWEAATTGRHVLRVRAADSEGNVQPDATPWNRSGYLWNGIDRVTCEIG